MWFNGKDLASHTFDILCLQQKFPSLKTHEEWIQQSKIFEHIYPRRATGNHCTDKLHANGLCILQFIVGSTLKQQLTKIRNDYLIFIQQTINIRHIINDRLLVQKQFSNWYKRLGAQFANKLTFQSMWQRKKCISLKETDGDCQHNNWGCGWIDEASMKLVNTNCKSNKTPKFL